MLFYERCAPRPEDAEKKQESMETLVDQPKFNFELTKELEEVSLFVVNDLSKTFMIWLSSILTLSVPDEGYSRNVLCTLKLNIYAFFATIH